MKTITGVPVLEYGQFYFTVTPEEYARVMGEKRYKDSLAYRADYGHPDDPWLVCMSDLLDYPKGGVVELTLRPVPYPEMERQERLVLEIARKTMTPNVECVGGETEDGKKYHFHLWLPDTEESRTVCLSDDEKSLVRRES